MDPGWVKLGKYLLKYHVYAAGDNGLFHSLLAEDVPPEQFAPLAVRLAYHLLGNHRYLSPGCHLSSVANIHFSVNIFPIRPSQIYKQ
jgi:hypothetical protein